MTIQDLQRQKVERLRNLSAGAACALAQAEATLTKPVKGIEAWLGYEFDSSNSLTEEFATFNREFKKWISQHLPAGAKLVNWSRGHFCCSAFIESQGKFVYLSCSDVRFFKDKWYNNLLIRTAQHDKDYTGGKNGYTDLPNFLSKVWRLLKEGT